MTTDVDRPIFPRSRRQRGTNRPDQKYRQRYKRELLKQGDFAKSSSMGLLRDSRLRCRWHADLYSIISFSARCRGRAVERAADTKPDLSRAAPQIPQLARCEADAHAGVPWKGTGRGVEAGSRRERPRKILRQRSGRRLRARRGEEDRAEGAEAGLPACPERLDIGPIDELRSPSHRKTVVDRNRLKPRAPPRLWIVKASDTSAIPPNAHSISIVWSSAESGKRMRASGRYSR
jgi:hypothetical protein